ncbi:alpha/beta fold hydrolase [Actinoallomurus rhizosphaericola]|uniref:alpha/beta fold hydrolase n=1 Tax=Actinoallomurus rhizosphaericola TaxID=2952536 RepID=UPI002092A253|nr:alpha/beta hydrolase [Actinoallomurus rhizosphaericola]MCO5999281.1 alpha/beta hydrolase [Actinoallomurus rhizosphaericola]
MAAVEVGRLAVPGASLHYEVRGTGPLLLLIAAGSSDATVFEEPAAVLAVRHRVISYDPRGNSRSVLHGPPVDQRVEVHADDAARLIDHVAAAGEPVHVFGSCSGGLVALELAVGRPDRIQRVVVHEPPAMALLPDAEEHQAFFEDVHEVFRRDGVAAALGRLSAIFGGSPPPALPRAHDNSAFFLAHVMRPFTRHVPDLTALEAVAGRVVAAGGEDSRAYAVHRPVDALAERLGHRPVLFPGGHMGYAKDPVGFAGRLVEVLAATAPSRER